LGTTSLTSSTEINTLVVWRNAGSPKSCATTTNWMEKMEIIYYRPTYRPTTDISDPLTDLLPTYFRPTTNLLSQTYSDYVPTYFSDLLTHLLLTYFRPTYRYTTEYRPISDLLPTYFSGYENGTIGFFCCEKRQQYYSVYLYL
jgi:hypothetical protein